MSNHRSLLVGDTEYTVNFYSSTRGVEILVRLSKMVGEPMGALFGGEGEGLETKVEKSLPIVAKALAQNLDKVETVQLVKDILSTTFVKGQQLQFDTHFQGRIGHMFAVVIEVLKYQYGDLKNVLGDAISRGLSMMSPPMNGTDSLPPQ